jgi:hypothetical protein
MIKALPPLSPRSASAPNNAVAETKAAAVSSAANSADNHLALEQIHLLLNQLHDNFSQANAELKSSQFDGLKSTFSEATEQTIALQNSMLSADEPVSADDIQNSIVHFIMELMKSISDKYKEIVPHQVVAYYDPNDTKVPPTELAEGAANAQKYVLIIPPNDDRSNWPDGTKQTPAGLFLPTDEAGNDWLYPNHTDWLKLDFSTADLQAQETLQKQLSALGIVLAKQLGKAMSNHERNLQQIANG